MEQSVHSTAAYFTERARYWREVYSSGDIYSVIYQERQDRVLHYVDLLSPGSNAPILEVGCGAGHLSLALAHKGYRNIDAVDSSEGMLLQAKSGAFREERAGFIRFQKADACRLPFRNQSYSLVIALGVLPWLDDPGTAIAECYRVLQHGGHAILTTDNLWRLVFLFDPRFNPVLGPVRRSLKKLLPRPDGTGAKNYRHSLTEFDGWINGSSFSVIDRCTLGFGPFTLFGREFLPKSSTLSLHHRLQELADRNVPLIRSAGSQYLVIARKSASH